MLTCVYAYDARVQMSKQMVEQGITGPEGHELCRPEEVCRIGLGLRLGG